MNSLAWADSLLLSEPPLPTQVLGEDVSPGVKKGGFVNMVRWKINCLCLGSSIPPHLEVDVSSLQLGDKVGLEALELPPGVLLNEKVLVMPSHVCPPGTSCRQRPGFANKYCIMLGLGLKLVGRSSPEMSPSICRHSTIKSPICTFQSSGHALASWNGAVIWSSKRLSPGIGKCLQR